MATKYTLTNIRNIRYRKVFFDANVLIYIFWPSGAYHMERDYSSAFCSLLRQNNELFVDFMVISEVINRIHHIEHEKYLMINKISKNDFTYKQFRNSDNGQSALNDIYLIIETNILKHFKVIGKSFTKKDISSFLAVNHLDFNDKAILLTCKIHACMLLTNDKDFKTADLDILSSNPFIFN